MGPVPELSGRELLREWRKLTDAMVDAVTSLAGQSEIPRQIAEPMKRQLELVEELLERERRLQAAVAERLLAPGEIAFGLLEQSGATMRRQAEALAAAGDALRETGALMTTQAELFDGAISKLRAPTDAARSVLGVKGDELPSQAGPDPADPKGG